MSDPVLANRSAFAQFSPTAADHFRLHFYAAVLELLERTAETFGSREAALEHFPFLVGYQRELTAWLPSGVSPGDAEARACWRAELRAWEQAVPGHLPIRALSAAANLSDHDALPLLLVAGLVEEDGRFGPLFATLQGSAGATRPTFGLLEAWWRSTTPPRDARPALRQLLELALLQATNPESARLEWTLQVPAVLWDAVRGDVQPRPAPGLVFTPPEQLVDTSDLIVPRSICDQLEILPGLLRSGEVQALVVRGPRANGRRTLLGALARSIGRGCLTVQGAESAATGWRLAGSLATLLHAVPVAVLELAPGDTAELARPPASDGPVGVVMGSRGGLHGSAVERGVTLELPVPDVCARRRHWQAASGPRQIEDLDQVSAQYHMTGGNIRRAASLANAHAVLGESPTLRTADVQCARRVLNRQALDTLAEFVEASGESWAKLVLCADTSDELRLLESRCRHRERLKSVVGLALSADVGTGVRALFSGPSGTGKTLAARVLASMLGLDLYRANLAAIVNKYIGETEKNLDQLFARAEELGVLLLLDEGDALLTARTRVVSANDRYANLETDFLLQRLDSFQGVLVVTTNASEHIDGAFQRRMDVVVEFRPPGPAERWEIWQLHLPPDHMVDSSFSEDLARRCELRGGQIRNAALHAALLALDNESSIMTHHLEAAVQREYRKAGQVCPLRSSGAFR